MGPFSDHARLALQVIPAEHHGAGEAHRVEPAVDVIDGRRSIDAEAVEVEESPVGRDKRLLASRWPGEPRWAESALLTEFGELLERHARDAVKEPDTPS